MMVVIIPKMITVIDDDTGCWELMNRIFILYRLFNYIPMVEQIVAAKMQTTIIVHFIHFIRNFKPELL